MPRYARLDENRAVKSMVYSDKGVPDGCIETNYKGPHVPYMYMKADGTMEVRPPADNAYNRVANLSVRQILKILADPTKRQAFLDKIDAVKSEFPEGFV